LDDSWQSIFNFDFVEFTSIVVDSSSFSSSSGEFLCKSTDNLVFSNTNFTDSNYTLIEASSITSMNMSSVIVTGSNYQLFKIISKYLHLLFMNITSNTYPISQSAIIDFATVPSIFIESQNVLVSNTTVSKNINTNGEIILLYHPQLENHLSNITIQSSRFSNNQHTAVKILNQGAIV